MPREGVPYPERLLCSLRCELKNIWNALSGKLHSINGVEGDGQGNVTIVSENAALTVNDYPLSNQIGLSLDPSQLPAADVNSVNGQTGVVVLNADDIPSDGSSDVQADIDALKATDTTLQGNINAEATTRANADSALQTNINNITASLPTEVVNALAADTTIVRTSGNQNIADIKTVATQATGSYSQQIANSTKVRNEIGSLAILQTGNQTVLGFKEGIWLGYAYTNPSAVTQGKWLRYMSFPCRYVISLTKIIGTAGNNGYAYALAITAGTNPYNRITSIINQPTNSGMKIACAINSGTNEMEFWIYISNLNAVKGLRFFNESFDNVNNLGASYYNTEHNDLPASGYTTFNYILGSP